MGITPTQKAMLAATATGTIEPGTYYAGNGYSIATARTLARLGLVDLHTVITTRTTSRGGNATDLDWHVAITPAGSAAL